MLNDKNMNNEYMRDVLMNKQRQIIDLRNRLNEEQNKMNRLTI